MIVARFSPTTSRKTPKRGPTFKRAPACYFCAPFVFITLQIPLPDCPSATAFIFMNLQIPFPQTLCLHMYTKPRGCHPPAKLTLDHFGTASRTCSSKKKTPRSAAPGRRQIMKRRNVLRAVTAAEASVLESLPAVALVSRPESWPQVPQPSLDTPDRRVSRCLG